MVTIQIRPRGAAGEAAPAPDVTQSNVTHTLVGGEHSVSMDLSIEDEESDTIEVTTQREQYELLLLSLYPPEVHTILKICFKCADEDTIKREFIYSLNPEDVSNARSADDVVGARLDPNRITLPEQILRQQLMYGRDGNGLSNVYQMYRLLYNDRALLIQHNLIQHRPSFNLVPATGPPSILWNNSKLPEPGNPATMKNDNTNKPGLSPAPFHYDFWAIMDKCGESDMPHEMAYRIAYEIMLYDNLKEHGNTTLHVSDYLANAEQQPGYTRIYRNIKAKYPKLGHRFWRHMATQEHQKLMRRAEQ